VETCPEVFELPEGADVARVKAPLVPAGAEEAYRQAADQCPVDNIRVGA
jgi:ferredoxin